MANSDESDAPGTRDVSPITLPPSPVAAKVEDHQVPAERSLSPSTDRDDNVSSATFPGAGALSAPAPSPAADATDDTSEDVDASGEIENTGDIDATEDISTTAVQTRCVINFLDPQPGKCDSKITNDDRHYISNFFGRNKACSTSIPDEFYQVLCRKCMQGMKYRLKSGHGATEIEVQVAAIKHVLRNMAASGRWVLAEVQLTKAEYDRRQNPKKYEKDINKFNEEIIKAREEAKQKGEKAKRRNTKKPPPPVPDWLAELVVRNDNDPSQDYHPIHERQPTRWSFEELIELVDMIGENCDVLPNIECLVVTQGELDEADLKTAKMIRKIAKDELGKLAEDKAIIDQKLRLAPKNKALLAEMQDVRDRTATMQDRLLDAEEDVKKYKDIAAKSAHTMPAKREQNKKPTTKKTTEKGESSKKGKKTKKDALKEQDLNDSQATLTDQDVQSGDDNDDNDDNDDDDDTRFEMIYPSSISRDVYSAESGSDSDNLPASPTPPPGWKGKGKADAGPSPSSKAQPSSKHTTRKPSSTTATASITKKRSRQVTPPAQTQAQALPVTPTYQPTTSSGSATTPLGLTSTTRSTGRRLQRMAERELEQQQEEGDGTVRVAESGSPVRKKFKGVKAKSIG